MRTTLRRSCNACAKAKHRCDLGVPHCARCLKKRSSCVYANQPLTHSAGHVVGLDFLVDGDGSMGGDARSLREVPPPSALAVLDPARKALDPFESYPPTRLPRVVVQRLIYHFLSSVAFQYYPLDLSMASNPFVVSWWPLALDDPALFHVSLQTASLDEERRGQNGFPISDLLMADSVSLLRRKVQDSAAAFRDETLNSVVTLAAIEHGKGNVTISRMHIDGVKRMVSVRGGIHELKRTSPLTARMVSWVSMLVTEAPQFETQDDSGFGNGVASIPQWHFDAAVKFEPLDLDIDPDLSNILSRLDRISDLQDLTSTELHDLTSFVIHRLLPLPSVSPDSARPATSECVRCALALYMLVLHRTTYYPHIHLAHIIMLRLHACLTVAGELRIQDPIRIWAVTVGMAAAAGIAENQFVDHAYAAALLLNLRVWEDVLEHLKSVLWMRASAEVFRQPWEEILAVANAHSPPRFTLRDECKG